jgi:hypothetical protein
MFSHSKFKLLEAGLNCFLHRVYLTAFIYIAELSSDNIISEMRFLASRVLLLLCAVLSSMSKIYLVETNGKILS